MALFPLKDLLDGTRKLSVQLTGSNVPDNNPIPIKSMGSVIQTQIILPRAIRQAGETNRTVLTPPDGAKGFCLIHEIYGITGTFTSGQGVNLECSAQTAISTSGSVSFLKFSFNKTTGALYHQVAIVYPGLANLGDMTIETGRQVKIASLPVSGMFWRVFLDITGTFAEGEGVDSQVFIKWLR